MILLKTFPDRFRGSLWLHFLDNAAALSMLVNASSSVIQGDILIGATWSQTQSLRDSNGLAVWNIVKLCVGLSQGQLVTLVTLAFPGSLLRALRPELGRREGSCANTLLALLIREGGSTSEHRDGLCAVVPVSHENLGDTASDSGSAGECAIDEPWKMCNYHLHHLHFSPFFHYHHHHHYHRFSFILSLCFRLMDLSST